MTYKDSALKQEKTSVVSPDLAALPPMPPELEIPATRGFNARKGDFMGGPIFNLTFNDGQIVKYGSPSGQKEQYNIPDGMTFEGSPYSFESNSVTYLASAAEYDQKLSASTKGQVKGMGYSASASSSIAYHGNMKLNSKYTYGLMFNVQQTYEINWYDRPALSETFEQAIKSLPASLATDADQAAYRKFFDKYGTSYLKSGVFGGYMTMQNRIEEELFEQTTEKEISAGIEAGYQGMVAGGSMSAEAAYSSSSFLSKHSKDILIEIHTNGGIKPADDKTATYFNSVFNSPILLLDAQPQGNISLEFVDIIDLFSVAGASGNVIETAAKARDIYLLEGLKNDGVIGVPSRMAFDTVYHASLAGFVNYNLSKTGNHQRAQVEAWQAKTQDLLASDPFPPFTSRASIDYHKKDSGGRDTYITRANLLLPVSANYYYRSRKSPIVSEGDPRLTGGFTPMGIGGLPALAAPENLGSPFSGSSNDPYVYKKECFSDGFIVVNLSANPNAKSDNGANFTGSVQAPGSSNKTMVNATSVYWHEGKHRANIPWQSICTPVRNGQTYYGVFQQTQADLGASYSIFWVPLQAPFTFNGALESRVTDTIYQAETDGFLTVYLSKSGGDDRGETTVYWDEENDMSNQEVLAQTSIQEHKDHETEIAYNSITVPIVKDRYYKVVTDTSKGTTKTVIHWIPVVLDPYSI